MAASRFRRLVAVPLLIGSAGVATAQGLTVTPTPFDNRDVPVLTLRNDQAEAVTLDSLAFARVEDGDGTNDLIWHVALSLITTTDTTWAFADCYPGHFKPVRCYGPGSEEEGLEFGPADRAELYFFLGCGHCRGPSQDWVVSDTLRVYSAGNPNPQDVSLTLLFLPSDAEGGPAPLPMTVQPNVTGYRTRVEVDVTRPGIGRVDIVDLLGRRVLALDRALGAGRQSVPLDVSGLAPGAYVVRVTAGGEVGTARLTVVR